MLSAAVPSTTSPTRQATPRTAWHSSRHSRSQGAR